MPESINSKLKEQYDHDDSGGSLDTNLGDFLDSEGASGTSNNSKWRDWASGTGTSLNTRLFHKHGGSGSFMTRWKNWIAFSSTHSFNFDGSNDYLLLDNESGGRDLLNNGASGSISVWVYAEALDQTSHSSNFQWRYPTIISKGNVHMSLIVTKDGAVLGFYYNSSASNVENIITANSIITTGNWHHIAWTWNASSSKLYVDGTERYSGSYTPYDMNSSGNNTDIYIGHNASSTAGNNAKWNGLIDELAIWRDIELSASDVTSIYNNGKVIDLSKSASYGTDRTGNLKLWLRCGDKAEPESTTAIARQDFYTDFDGTNDYITVGNPTNLQITGSLSISCWVKTNGSLSGYKRLVSKDDGSNRSYILHSNNGKPVFFIFKSGSSASSGESSVDIDDGNWHHVLGLNDGTNLTIYVDGVQTATSTDGGTIDNDSANFEIGRYQADSEYFEGQISNVSVYKTALDAQTIKQFAKSRFTPMRDNRFSVVDFDGSDDRIIAGNLFSGGGSTATFSIWVFADESGGSVDRIVGQTNSSSNMPDPFEVQWNHSDNTIRAWIADGTASNYKFINSNATTANEWHHVVVTFDLSTATIKIYIDGVDETGSANSLGSPPTSIVSTSTPLKMGESAAGDRFKGSMSSVAIYDTVKDAYALYQKGITYNESSETSLIAYYRMGDDTSKAFPTIADSSSNSNDGTMTNMASDDIVQQMVAGYDLGAFESSSEELSAERITNGDFSAWTADNPDGWSVSTDLSGGVESDNVKVTEDANGARIISDGTNINLRQNSAMIIGTMYKVVIVVHSATSGNIKTDGLTSNITNINASGTYTVTTTASSTTLNIKRNTACDIVVSSVSVKEVLQSEVSDTHPAIIDVNEPVLGVESLTDGDSLSTSKWGANSGQWTFSGGKGVFDGTGNAYIFQTSGNMANTLSVSKMYNLTFTISEQGGTGAKLSFYDSNVNPAYSETAYPSGGWDNGTHSHYFVTPADVGDNGLAIFAEASGGAFKISNISLKQVLGNVGTMTNQATSDLVYSSVLPDQSFLTGVNSAYNFIDLDGSNEYIDTGSPFQSTFRNSSSISTWIKPTDGIPSAENMIMGSKGGGNLYFSIDTSGKLRLYINDGSSEAYAIANSATFSNGQEDWHYVVAVINNSTEQVSLYLDGSAITLDGTYDGDISSLTLSNFTSTRNQYIGARNNLGTADRFFNGDVGQTAIYNKALSSTEVSAIYTLGRHGNLLDSYSDNLVGYWAMSSLDGKTGLSDVGDGTIYDRSGNSNHGTATNTESADLKSSPNAESNGYAKGDTNRSTTTP